MAPLVRLLPPREIDTHLKHLISNLVVNHWLSINFRSTQEASGATLCVDGLCALGGCGQTETTLTTIQTAVNKQTEQSGRCASNTSDLRKLLFCLFFSSCNRSVTFCYATCCQCRLVLLGGTQGKSMGRTQKTSAAWSTGFRRDTQVAWVLMKNSRKAVSSCMQTQPQSSAGSLFPALPMNLHRKQMARLA